MKNVLGAFPWCYASKNKAVCYDVQIRFGSFSLAKCTKKLLGIFSQLMRPKTKLFAVRIWKFFTCKVYKKSSGRIFTIYVSRKQSCFLWNLDTFSKVSARKIYKNVLITFSQIMCRANILDLQVWENALEMFLHYSAYAIIICANSFLLSFLQ